MKTEQVEQSWLPLADYSMKYKISVSTLRRRIKADDIKYRFDDGKYLILDEHSTESSSELQEHRSSQKNDDPGPTFKSSPDMRSEFRPESKHDAGESVITAANRLLADLKKAYTQVLQEKEQQIMQLHQEISALNTLIRVLEAENARLRGD